MRILHITPDYYPAMGGGELYVKEISERLARRDHDVTVLTMNSRGLRDAEGHPLKSREVINRVTVKRLNHTYETHQRLMGMRGAHAGLGLALGPERLRMLALSPFSLSAFLSTLRADVDVVAMINWYHGSLAAQTCVARRCRNFALVGIPLFHTERAWSQSPLFGGMFDRCDALVVMTEHEKRFIAGRSSQENIHVVGAGVEPAPFAKADGRGVRVKYGIGDAPLVGYVGRMSPSKGVVMLIEAMKIVWRSNPGVRLLLAGSGFPADGSSTDEVGTVLTGLSESERSNVIVVRRFDDEEKASIFDALDLFVMTSVAESFGIAYLEAWMCGKAVIGSRVGSTECVIRDQVDGVLVTPDNHRELAGSIVQLLQDVRLREAMGRAGRAKAVSQFTWEKVADRIERIYKNAQAERESVGRTPAEQTR